MLRAKPHDSFHISLQVLSECLCKIDEMRIQMCNTPTSSYIPQMIWINN